MDKEKSESKREKIGTFLKHALDVKHHKEKKSQSVTIEKPSGVLTSSMPIAVPPTPNNSLVSVSPSHTSAFSPVKDRDSFTRLSQEFEGNSSLMDKPFLVCERTRVKSWANQEKNAIIVSECEELRGFKLYAVEEWLFDPALLFWVLMEYTGSDDDKILVSIARPTLNLSHQQRKYIESIFYKPSIDGLKAKETSLGVILVRDQINESKYTLIHIPDGDYDKHYNSLVHQLTLKRMGCGSEPISLTSKEPLASMETKFYSLYSIPSPMPATKAVQQILEEVQTYLLHLHLLPYMNSVDGIYSNGTMGALMKFQRTYNTAAVEKKLPTTGYLTPETYRCLAETIVNIKNKLDRLGFKSNDPIRQALSFTEAVRSFQKANGLFTDGRLSKETRTELDRIWEEKADKLTKEEQKLPLQLPISPPLPRTEPIIKPVDKVPNVDKPIEKDDTKVTVRKQPNDPMEQELMRRLSVLTEKAEKPHKKTKEKDKSDSITKFLFNKCFVSCERAWADQLDIEIISECEQLTGYKVSVVEEWVLEFKYNERACVVEKTGDPNDKVLVVILQPKASITTEHEKIVKSYLLPTSEQFFSEQTPYGTILLYDRPSTLISSNPPEGPNSTPPLPSPNPPTSSPQQLSFIPLNDGDFDKHIEDVKLHLTLRRLGCGYYPTFIEEQVKYLGLMEHKLRALYGIGPSIPIATVADSLVKQLKAAMINLMCLPTDTEIDGTYDTTMMDGIKAFQTQYMIKPTGLMNGTTFQAIMEKLMQLRTCMESYSVQCPEDPFREYEGFAKSLRSYDKHYDKKGAMDRKTLLKSDVMMNNSPTEHLPNLPRSENPTKSLEAVEEVKLSERSNVKSPTPTPTTSAVMEVGKLKQKLKKEKLERDRMKKTIEDLQGTIDKQNQTHNQLRNDYENMEKNYNKLKEEAQEAMAKIQLYKIQLSEAKKSFTRLNHEYSHTNELIREHNDTIRNYSSKINRLEDTVQNIQRHNRRNFLTVIATTLLTWLLSLIAILVLGVTSAIDFVKKITGRGEASTKQMKHFLLNQKKLLEEVGIFEKTFDTKDTKEEDDKDK